MTLMTPNRAPFLAATCLAVLALVAAGGNSSQEKPAERKSAEFAFDGSEKLLFKETPQGDLHLHVFRPQDWKAADRRPGIVFFFGGGWTSGNPGQFEQHCRYFASRGMVAISAEYRVRSRHQTLPYDCVEDGKSALRWTRARAGELGIDPQRLAAGGGSAGGHVAAATATTKTIEEPDEDHSIRSTPDALVLFNPVYDNGPGQWGHDRVKERWQEISPAHNIGKGMPPAIVFLGSADKLIPVETAKQFQEKMRAVGARSELKITEGAGHGFFNHGREDNQHFIRTVTQADQFLIELGWLSGEPKVRQFVEDAGAR